MDGCKIKKGDSIWPEENDISGDGIFALDSNQLIKEIRAVRRKAERDLFLESLDEPTPMPVMTDTMEITEPSKDIKLVKYQDLTKKDKIAYIINQLEKYKKDDL